MTKQKLGVFAEVAGELKLIHTGSVRFSRANRAALKADQFHKGVFFAHYDYLPAVGVSPAFGIPTGLRHKPKHLTFESLGLKSTPFETLFPVEAAVADARKRRPRRRKPAELDYNAVDPQTGEMLGDVLVDMYRERLARESK